MKLGATVVAVTPGQTTRLEAKTPDGRLVVLEVPGPQAAGYQVGDKLIVDWAIFRFPEIPIEERSSSTTTDEQAATLFRRR